jgi:hypothetical protein
VRAISTATSRTAVGLVKAWSRTSLGCAAQRCPPKLYFCGRHLRKRPTALLLNLKSSKLEGHCRGRARPIALLHKLASRKGKTAAPFCDGQRRHDPLRIVFGAQRLDAFPQIPRRPHARTIVLCRSSGSLHIRRAVRITITTNPPLASIAASPPPNAEQTSTGMS